MRSPDPIETEIKLGLPDAAAWQRLRTRLGPGRVVDQANYFLDVPSGSFRAARIGIRLRDEDGLRTLTAKGDAGLPSTPAIKHRIELESPIESVEFDRALAEGLDLSPWTLRWREEWGTDARVLIFLERLEECAAEGALTCFGHFKNFRERCPLRLETADGPLEFEVEIDRTEFPGGRVDFEVEVEIATPGGQTSDGGGSGSTSAERTHRALVRWLESEIGLETFSVPSKLARLNAILESQSDSSS